ncbi:MAG: pseudouridine synthase [Oceanicoccus sp.]|jgi:pseudouridine synthase
MSLNDGIRLNKFISDSGQCSRREADKLIDSNRVKINGRKPALGSRVEDGDEVTVDGMQIYSSAPNKSDRVYLAYNKPIGITCTTEQNVKGNIVDAVDHDQRIFPIGRLDKPSEGLILLTSDGDIVNKILRAENAHDKEYLVSVNKAIGPGFADKMSKGIPILDTITKPCKVSIVSKSVFKITLTQGLNRQIRRMCEHLGYKVTQLVRLRIMNIELGKMRPGQWRKLSRDEMAQLTAAIADSSNSSSKNDSPRRSRPKSKPRNSAGGYTSQSQTGDKNSDRRDAKKTPFNKNTKNKSAKAGGGPKTDIKAGAKSIKKSSKKKSSSPPRRRS